MLEIGLNSYLDRDFLHTTCGLATSLHLLSTEEGVGVGRKRGSLVGHSLSARM